MHDFAMTEEDKMRKAKQQVEMMTGFYVHLAVYVLVNAMLVAINWFTSPQDWWAQWALLGWGVGVLGHALLVFMPVQGTFERWKARKIREARARMS